MKEVSLIKATYLVSGRAGVWNEASSNVMPKYTLLLSLHSGNNFPILIGNLHCLLTHPTAHNTVFGTNEQSPTADLT